MSGLFCYYEDDIDTSDDNELTTFRKVTKQQV